MIIMMMMIMMILIILMILIIMIMMILITITMMTMLSKLREGVIFFWLRGKSVNPSPARPPAVHIQVYGYRNRGHAQESGLLADLSLIHI